MSVERIAVDEDSVNHFVAGLCGAAALLFAFVVGLQVGAATEGAALDPVAVGAMVSLAVASVGGVVLAVGGRI